MFSTTITNALGKLKWMEANGACHPRGLFTELNNKIYSSHDMTNAFVIPFTLSPFTRSFDCSDRRAITCSLLSASPLLLKVNKKQGYYCVAMAMPMAMPIPHPYQRNVKKMMM